jgi:hypothetical protein
VTIIARLTEWKVSRNDSRHKMAMPAECRRRSNLKLGYREMVLSLSHALDADRPEESAAGSVLGTTAYQAGDQRIKLDLGTSAGFAQLRRMNAIWPDLSDVRRRAWLDSREIVLPPRTVAEADIALLPGGAVALRGSGEFLVCDPVEATIFSHAEVKHLRRVLRTRADVSTLSHTATGIVLRKRVPKKLPPQAVTVVPNATRLPIRVAFTGPVLIQWGLHGAVARPLVPAPELLALAASVAVSPRINKSGLAPEPWQATGAADRRKIVSWAIGTHLAGLLDGAVCDELQLALLDNCVDGPESLVTRIAKALAVLPACFTADQAALPGSPPPIWRHALDHVRGLPHPRVLLGLDELNDPLLSLRALRATIEHADVLAFNRNGTPVSTISAELHGDAALFLARKTGLYGNLGLAIPTPSSPVELYVLALEVARTTGGRVIAVAPDWGFCHRIAPNGEESGNAGWFGMGAGLDEVEIISGDIDAGA